MLCCSLKFLEFFEYPFEILAYATNPTQGQRWAAQVKKVAPQAHAQLL